MLENIIDNICAMTRRDADLDFLQRCRKQLLLPYKAGVRTVAIGGASITIVSRFCADIASVHVEAKPEGDHLVMVI